MPFLLAAVCTHGCRANCDLVEAELRDKERQLEEAKQQLDLKSCDIQALEVEIEQLYRRTAKPGAEPLGSRLIVKQIALGRLTGGYDQDPDCPGDEALQILLEPRDADDQSVKAPGVLHVDLYEVSPQGLKSPLSSWDVPARELRKKWETPVFGGPAYRVILPWKTWPTTENLRVVARFMTPDGQQFEADKDITVRLPDRPKRQPQPSRTPIPEPAGPHLKLPGTEILPSPRVFPHHPVESLLPPCPPDHVAPIVQPSAFQIPAPQGPPPTPSGGLHGAKLLPPLGARLMPAQP
jgi:hypothetical protein